MENANPKAADSNSEENPNNGINDSSNGNGAANRRSRTAFTDLSQVDADLALARTLQEQERAYLMLRMGGLDGSDYGSWEEEAGNDEYDEEDYGGYDLEVGVDARDAFGVQAQGEGIRNDNRSVELDPSAFSSDEAYARALQDAEAREMTARLFSVAGINEMIVGEEEDEGENGHNSQEAWGEVDPDELSYEELVALGEVVGTESRGLSAETIASLPQINYKSQGIEEGSCDSCVICRSDYEDDDTLTVLSCKHSYHSDCINNWLHVNKVCPVCSTEVSTSEKS